MSENDIFENSPEERGDEMIVQSGNPLKNGYFWEESYLTR